MEKPNEQQLEGLIKRLKQQFGRHLAREPLEAVLEMFNYNFKEAQAFLQAENQDQNAYDFQQYVPPANNGAEDQSILPKDYYKPPEGFAEAMEVDQGPSEPAPGKPDGEEEKKEKLKELFTRQSTFQEHFQAQQESLLAYLSTLVVLVKSGMEVKDSSKARCLAALWSRKSFKVADYLLSPSSNNGAGYGFGLPEVLKAVNLLDSARKIRVLEKRMNLLHRQAKVRQRTLGKVNSTMNDLRREPVQGSLSGSLIKRIRGWAKTLPAKDLEFYALHLPKEPWKELADLLHLNPKKDMQEPWFLPVAFGEKPPEGSILEKAEHLSADNALPFVLQFSPPYNFMRKKKELLSAEVLSAMATYTPLETLIWFYEEFQPAAEKVNPIIQEKLRQGEPLKLGYGKLMERLLTFKSMGAPFFEQMIPAAEEKLKEINVSLEPPIVCFGDASYSMDVAIRVSTIIASLMTALTNADLRFFNTESIVPPKLPRTIQDVLELTMSVKADKLTAPAAALKEFYESKIPVNTFIVVTDEVENIPYEGDFFAQLFYKYRKEVQPGAEIVFVSFLPNQNTQGRMVRALQEFGIKPKLEMRLDGTRPDLTKLDSMLALLSANTKDFKKQVEETTEVLERGDLPVHEKLAQIEASF